MIWFFLAGMIAGAVGIVMLSEVVYERKYRECPMSEEQKKILNEAVLRVVELWDEQEEQGSGKQDRFTEMAEAQNETNKKEEK